MINKFIYGHINNIGWMQWVPAPICPNTMISFSIFVNAVHLFWSTPFQQHIKSLSSTDKLSEPTALQYTYFTLEYATMWLVSWLVSSCVRVGERDSPHTH